MAYINTNEARAFARGLSTSAMIRARDRILEKAETISHKSRLHNLNRMLDIYEDELCARRITHPKHGV